MLWEVEIRPTGRDGERERVCDEFDLLTHSVRGADVVSAAARGYLLEGDFNRAAIDKLCDELLVDPVVEKWTVSELGTKTAATTLTVLFKPGVMDPTTLSVRRAAADLGVPVAEVRTFRRYFTAGQVSNLPGPNGGPTDIDLLCRKILANDAIEQVIVGPLHADHLTLGTPYSFKLITVPIRDLADDAFVALSKQGQLALTLEEMQTVQAHFRHLGRDPTDCELESIAQTWSEHCSHKTLKGTIDYTETIDGRSTTRRYGNLLKETIFAATQTIRQKLGADDWCVSVFSDNAGVVKFDEHHHVCFKVETHNRPSAIEPYGGANTGLGGVIRDVLGTGLGGKPICNTDVFCFARPDFAPEELPPGVLHPRRVIHGVVAGVRDYGNRMGIPTVNGSVIFDDRYLANPLVFCGTVGLIPVGMESKQVNPGDLIVAVGATGRDGIHGATFSSLELTEESEVISGGAVQIGNAIEEKKVLDVILQARDRGLYTAITDCGAGGFSSAVGEMGAECGADVTLETAPLKYAGLSYTEIWISESQERMVLAVPQAKWPELEALCKSEDVSAAILGRFTDTGRLKLTYQGELVGDIAMSFLHDGRPDIVRNAEYYSGPLAPRADVDSRSESTTISATYSGPLAPRADVDLRSESTTITSTLLQILGSLSVCSKEWIVRQYDHEVQGGSVIKPLVGVKDDGPSDAAVVMPVLGSWTGLAIGNGLNPRYADLDPYRMAAAAIDEAVRNVVAVGGDPSRTAILDNFCWGNVNDPAMLGALVRTAEACRDVSIAYGTPFISGKDSLNNEYRSADRRITIPHTLLISAMARVSDVRRCVTMDLKEPGNRLFLVGETKNELGGSHYHLVTGQTGGVAPLPDLERAPRIFAALHRAITEGLIRSCHDLSEGGLAIAIAEMAFAGGIGADLLTLPGTDELPDHLRLFSESTTRFILEVKPENVAKLTALFANLPLTELGKTVPEPRLRIAGNNGEWIVYTPLAELKAAWQAPLRW